MYLHIILVNVLRCPSGPGSFLFQEDIMVDKKFKTYDEQLNILSDRGITFSDHGGRKKAKLILQREGYYKLINGYKELFLLERKPEDKYIPNTTVSEIFALYSFDRTLREIFLRYILHVETNIKNLISYNFSEKYGHDNFLRYGNFNTSMKEAGRQITSLIADIQRQISSNTSDPCIKHYLQNYGYIPMWVLNNILTLGTISRFYSVMKIEDRQSISKVFKILDNNLESFLYYLSIVRNFSAHGNRLYCLRTSRPLVDTKIHKNLSIPIKGDEYINGKRDLFAAVIALRYLTSVNEYKKIINELTESIDKLADKLNVIAINKVLDSMGFPDNWKDIVQKGIK